MRKLKLIIEYDGTAYSGWQSQKNGIAIQDVVGKALCRMTEKKIVLKGASRTDAGVHALGQVAVFETSTDIPCDGFLKGVNGLLPEDIRILSVGEAPKDFHPILDAKRKTYRYSILNAPVPSALLRNRCWHLPQSLDLQKMKEGAKHFFGKHDFKSFQGGGGNVKTTEREIYRIEVMSSPRALIGDPLIMDSRFRGDDIRIEIEGNGFLKHMVRNIVGTLVEVGLGKRDSKTIPDLILGKDRRKAGPTAPPQGLCLVRIDY